MNRRLPFLLPLLVLLGCTARAEPGGIPWKESHFSYFAQDQEVGNVLKNFGMMQGVRIIVSPNVKGEISGRFDKIPPDRFLGQMARANGLNWLWDGSVLYVSRADENQTRIVQMDPSVYDRFAAIVDGLGFQGSDITIRKLDEKGSILLAGPPRFFQISDGILKGVEIPASEMRVRVFPLKNAWANDLTFDYRETKVTVPGVAAALRDVMGDSSRRTGRMGNGSPEVTSSARLEGLRGTGLAAVGAPGAPAPEESNSPEPLQPSAPNGSSSPSSARPTGSVHADVRLNAIVVRDSAERMPIYEELIRQLDVPVSLIEISAAIIDLNSNYAFDLGNDFILSDSRGSNQYRAGVVNATSDTAPGAAGLGTVGGSATNLSNASLQNLIGTGGFSGSALIVRDGVQLLANIHAIEGKGKARILSRPAVMTLDNTEAIIRDDQTFYVRVAGDTSTDLFNVSAGVLLKVTPHVVSDSNHRPQIKLVVNIKDGTVSDQQVDNIPVVSKSSISTQAAVLESQSLLIGGMYHEQRSKATTGVPGLQHIPLLGALFKRKTADKSKMERLFLITPRIVSLSYTGAPDVSGLFDTPLAEDHSAHPLRSAPKLIPFTDKTSQPGK